ncbi:MAG: hypothetical protein ACW99G_06970 [Candidatus Thorarchaeota archaeon]|jgi:hypothetical protein
MSNVSHPVFNFRVNLELLSTEKIGPKTNSINVGMLHPTRHQDDQDNAVVEQSNFKDTRSTWKPGVLGMNGAYKDGDTFTAYGVKGLYLRDTYGIGYAPADRACLEIL